MDMLGSRIIIIAVVAFIVKIAIADQIRDNKTSRNKTKIVKVLKKDTQKNVLSQHSY